MSRSVFLVMVVAAAVAAFAGVAHAVQPDRAAAMAALLEQTASWDQAYFKELHPTVAALALDHFMTAKTKAAVRALVPDLPAEAGWADRITFTEPKQTWSSPLHFINVEPAWTCAYNRARDCKKDGVAGICVDNAIQNYTAQLANTKLAAPVRADALKFLTHFVGDIHQPLHAGNGVDWGGNKLQGTLIDPAPVAPAPVPGGPPAPAPKNLHAIWDADIAQRRIAKEYAGDAKRWAAAIARKYKRNAARWSACRNAAYRYGQCSDEWANESAQLACRYAYNDERQQPLATGFVLSEAYYRRAVVVVEEQIVKAAVRLASVCNKIFDAKKPATKKPAAKKPAGKPAAKKPAAAKKL